MGVDDDARVVDLARGDEPVRPRDATELAQGVDGTAAEILRLSLTGAGLLLILAGSWLATDGRLPPGLGRLARRATSGARRDLGEDPVQHLEVLGT